MGCAPGWRPGLVRPDRYQLTPGASPGIEELISRGVSCNEDLRPFPALERAELLLALLSALRSEIHQAQGRAWGKRPVHHDLEPHGYPPRRAAPFRHGREDDRRALARVVLRPGRSRGPAGRDGRAGGVPPTDDREAGSG